MTDIEQARLSIGQTQVQRPQIQHTVSQRSAAADEDNDFHSATSGETRPGTADSSAGLVVNRMSALRSHPNHPHHHEGQPLHPVDTPGADSFLPPTQDTFERLQQDTYGSKPRPRSVSSPSQPIRRKPVNPTFYQNSPVSSSDSNDKVSDTLLDRAALRSSGTSNDIPTPTDDGPYIRFALDQLTRDEEVRGSRRYPTHDRWSSSPRGAAFGSIHRRKSSGDRYSQIMSRSHDMGRGAPLSTILDSTSQIAGPDADADIQEAAPAYRQKALPAAPGEAAAMETTMRARAYSSHSSDDGYVTPAEEPRPQSGRFSQPIFQTTQLAPTSPYDDVFVRFDQEVPPLKFLPGILKPLSIGTFIFLHLLVLAALAFSGVYSTTSGGLFAYTTFGDARYFIFQYLPLIIAMFLLLWLLQIQVALQRVAPFIAMASESSKSRSEAPLMPYQPTNFLLPKVSYFRAGQPVIGVAMVIFWLQIFNIPLMSTLYTVRFYGAPASGNWRWITTIAIVWTLFALYALLVIALVVLGIWLWRQRTGLRWDPRSLGDLIALIDRSNIFGDYLQSEVFASHRDFYQRIGLRSDRLGYWTTSYRPEAAFYGIGEEGGAARRPDLVPGSPNVSKEHEAIDLEDEDELHFLRSRYLPWYLRTTWALLWVVAGILLYLAFLIVSFINDATLRGFRPLLPVAPNAEGFSSTNFLYSFVPALIGQFLFLAWLSIDYAFRRLQPYAGLSAFKNDQIGGSAQHTLLLDYTSRMPFSVTLAALLNRNLRVAWFSFLSLIAATLPILAGGCFWAQYYVPMQEVRVAVDPSAFYALCVFLAMFAFSLPFLLFGMRKRRLPHACTTLADQISWLYASRILGEREWRAPLGSKTEMNTHLLTAITPAERELSGSHFYFGHYIGVDGRPHIGIDRIGRETQYSKGSRLVSSGPYREGYARSHTSVATIGRSRSGRFVSGTARPAGHAGAETAYDEKAYYSAGQHDPMPRVAPFPVQGAQPANNRSMNRLSESDKPAAIRAHAARGHRYFPSESSSFYPPGQGGNNAGTARNSAMVNPFADPIEETQQDNLLNTDEDTSTVRRSNTDPRWFTRARPAPTTGQPMDSMADLAETEKPEYIRSKAARGKGY